MLLYFQALSVNVVSINTGPVCEKKKGKRKDMILMQALYGLTMIISSLNHKEQHFNRKKNYNNVTQTFWDFSYYLHNYPLPLSDLHSC